MINKFLSIFFLLSFGIFANLRAPAHDYQNPSYAVSRTGNNLIVLKESLNFQCPNFSPNERNTDVPKCKVTAIYEVQSTSNGNYKFTFISPSPEETLAKINEEGFMKIQPQQIEVNEHQVYDYHLQLEFMRKRKSNKIYQVNFRGSFQQGKNIIQVNYEQPLSRLEIEYGYFKSSKWAYELRYELWPLKEWNLDENFSIQVNFQVDIENSFLGLFSDSTKLTCHGISNRFEKYPYSLFQEKFQMKDIQNLHEDFFQKADPDFDPKSPPATKYEIYTRIQREKMQKEISESKFEDFDSKSSVKDSENTRTYSLLFKKDFPDSLYCSYKK